MRLGKEQAVGVIQEPADAGSVPVDGPRVSEADEQRSSVERAEAILGASTLSEEGTFVRAR